MKNVAENLPLVSIVVSNHNGIELNLLEDCLESVFEIDYPNFEVILVDNDSTDGSVDHIKKQLGSNSRLRVIENLVNMYSQGLNLGVGKARGKYVVFFNNDIKVARDYLMILVDVLEKDERIGLAQGKLLSESQRDRIDSAGEAMDLYGNPITIGAGEADVGQYRAGEILSASGSASVVRKSVFDEVGLFDTDYGIGYEDIDLALRIRLREYKVLFVPEAIVYHKRGSTDRSSRVRLRARRHFNTNRIVTILKNYNRANLLKALPVTTLLYIVAFLWEAVGKREFRLAATRLTALGWNVRNLGATLKKRQHVQQEIRKVPDKEITRLMPRGTLVASFRKFVRAKW